MPESKDFKTNISVFGDKYTLRGGRSPEYVKRLAGYIDDVMFRLSERNATLNKTQLAVLAALNTADELFKQKEEYESLIQMLESESGGKRNPGN